MKGATKQQPHIFTICSLQHIMSSNDPKSFSSLGQKKRLGQAPIQQAYWSPWTEGGLGTQYCQRTRMRRVADKRM